MAEPIAVTIGMRVQLRKPHACGGDVWTVARTGADIGLTCDRCARRVLLEREEFERRVKRVEAAPSLPSAPALKDRSPE